MSTGVVCGYEPEADRRGCTFDSRRAAEALVDEDTEEVFLYGSVARGEATPLSDIDLVALFADIGL